MDQENNYRRRKSEDGYSNANRPESGDSRTGNYRERNTSGTGFNNYRGYDNQSSGQSPEMRKKRPRIKSRTASDNPFGKPMSYGGDNSYGRPAPFGGGDNSFGRPTPFGGGDLRKKTIQRPNQNQNDEKRYDPNDKYSKKKQLEYKELLTDPNVPLRLNKYLANAGICSRREADEYIQAGVVKVNGEVVTELGKKIFRTDHIVFHDKPVSLEKKAYILLNKPRNCVTTSDDPQERLTVMDLVKTACKERIYPVGRLDKNTTGVLLLTNDGELASKLTHPKFLKKKIYHVVLNKPLTDADMRQILNGVELDDEKVRVDAIDYVKEDDKKEVGVEIHIGKNRIVRRIFDQLDYKVIKLDRVYFAGLTKKSLSRGKWRYLTQKEVDMLQMGAFE